MFVYNQKTVKICLHWMRMKSLVEKKCNSYKIIAKTSARSCKRMHYYWQTLAMSCKICLNLVKFLQELYSVWTNLGHNIFVIALEESDTYVSKFCVFFCKNVQGISQSIQNLAFGVGSENGKNDLIQKDEKKIFHFVFLFRRIKPLQNIWVREIPYPWCF